ncbi:hypothetical protein EKD04_015135 [Chloroflexales bacterium ZM16-3]|nr:hypothetical protein [Chloroflexales bacterium ZM16-3]
MTLTETLRDIKFVVGPDGRPTAALVDIAAWQHLVDLLEEAEDQGLLRGYLARRRTARTPEELGLISWEQAEAELDAREEASDAPVG